MKILVVGFQRSGTTLLRRIFSNHPEVKKMFHEKNLLNFMKTKNELKSFIDFDIDKYNWGEKVAYFPSIRKKPTVPYCKNWVKIFGKDDCRIIHIIRHPYDLAFSSQETFKVLFDETLRIYKNIIKHSFLEINKIPSSITIKYENLITNPDIVIKNLYRFCNLSSDIDYKDMLKLSDKKQYQQINKDRCFSYKNKKIKNKYEWLNDIFKLLNDIEGPKYENL